MFQTQQPPLFTPVTPAPVPSIAPKPIRRDITENYLKRKPRGAVPPLAINVIFARLGKPYEDTAELFQQGDFGRTATQLSTLAGLPEHQARRAVLRLLAQHIHQLSERAAAIEADT